MHLKTLFTQQKDLEPLIKYGMLKELSEIDFLNDKNAENLKTNINEFPNVDKFIDNGDWNFEHLEMPLNNV